MFSLPSPAKEGSDTAALMGSWCPARVTTSQPQKQPPEISQRVRNRNNLLLLKTGQSEVLRWIVSFLNTSEVVTSSAAHKDKEFKLGHNCEFSVFLRLACQNSTNKLNTKKMQASSESCGLLLAASYSLMTSEESAEIPEVFSKS